jgi:predicted permease
MLLRGAEARRVEDALAELYAWKRQEDARTADAWYRRQVFGFAVRLPALTRRGGWFERKGGGGMDSLRQDLGFAVRQFVRRPAFALLAVVTIGLGIGAATAIFGMVRAVVLEPLPYPDAGRLVEVLETTPDGRDFSTSESNFLDFHERNRTFERLAAYRQSPLSARFGDEPIQLEAMRVTAEFFAVLGGAPAFGRVFTGQEAGAQPALVAVVSNALWRDAFGADRQALGRTVLLDGIAHEMIGVMPAGWEPETDIWLPQQLDPAQDRGDHMLRVIGLLAGGATSESAHADLMAIQRDLSARFPESNGGWGVAVRPLKLSFVGAGTVRAGWFLLGAVGLLLLLACASVSSLLVARATTRRREVALRTAIGASPARVLRQLMTEAAVLSLAGGVFGVMLAYGAMPLLRTLSPPGTPRIEEATIDPTVLAFAFLVTVGVGILFGLAPTLHALRADVRDALADGDRGATSGGERIRSALVVAQIAVAFALVVGVGLLAASFARLRGEDPGIAVAGMLAVPLTLPWEQYDADNRVRVLREIEARIAAVPGVSAAGLVNVAPFTGSNTMNDLSVEGIAYDGNENPFARWRSVSVGYFEAAGVAIIAGRPLRSEDRGLGAGDRAAAVVSETMARQIWGSPEAALGRRFAMSRNSINWNRVVGVSEDVRDHLLDEAPLPQFFFPDGGWWPWMTLVLRTDAELPAIANAIRTAIWEVAPDLPVPTIEPVARNLAGIIAGPRFNFVLTLVFGTVALTLAIMGVYGITHLAVSRRAREIGIRMALGGSVAGMVGLVVRRSARLAIAGVALGLALAVASARAIQAILFRTSPLDPAILGGAAAVLLTCALVAAWIPARRAASVDPASVLRAD